MKMKYLLGVVLLFGIMAAGCNEKEEEPVVAEVTVDLLNDEFPDAKAEVAATIDSIAQSVKDGDIDKLITFHAYGPKFTEFKNGEPRNDGAENENFERTIFSGVTEVKRFDMNDMKIDVYGDVANVTLHSDFHLMMGENLAVVNEQMSLLFVKTKAGWRIVHEHHSPLNMPETE